MHVINVGERVVDRSPYSALTDQPHSTDLSKYDNHLKKCEAFRQYGSKFRECSAKHIVLKDMFEIHKETCSHSNLQNIYDHSNSMTIKSSWRRPPKQDNSLVQL